MQEIAIQGKLSGEGNITNIFVEKNTVYGERNQIECGIENFDDRPLILKINDFSSCISQESNIPRVFDFSQVFFEENHIPFEKIAAFFPHWVRFFSSPPNSPDAVEFTKESGFPLGNGSYEIYFEPYMGKGNSCPVALKVTSFDTLLVEVSSIVIPDCENNELFKMVNINISGGIAPYEIEWLGDGIIQDEGTQNYIISKPGSVELIIRDQSRQKFTSTLELEAYERQELEIDISSESLETHGKLLVGIPITLSTAFDVQNSSIEWEIGTDRPLQGNSVNVTFENPGSYLITLNVEDKWGCRIQKEITIELIDHFLVVPEVFSPNEDGLNDYFYPIFTLVDEIEFSIYNKWGELIFFTNNI